MPPAPEVVALPVLLPAAPLVGVVDVIALLLDESPIPLIALPPAVTGAFTPTRACRPLRMPCAPVVVALPVWLPVAVPSVAVVDVIALLLDESPITLIALPPIVTGAVTDPRTWLPPPMLFSPEVVAVEPPDAAAGVAAPVAVFVVAPLDDELPITLIALPPTVTGTLTCTSAWLPDSAPASPEVLTATDGGLAAGVAAELVDA